MYTAFERMTRTAEPILRPLWLEFPDDTSVYEIFSEFMVGNGILFAPKTAKPSRVLSQIAMQEISFYLPASAKWYNYVSKTEETATA